MPLFLSHTVGLMTLAKGARYATSRLVVLNDVLSQILWTTYFLEAQGAQSESATINQDNMSNTPC